MIITKVYLEYFLAAQQAHYKSTNATSTKVISKFGEHGRNQVL